MTAFLILTLLSVHFAFAETDPNVFAAKDEMNEVKYSDYAGFEQKWQLVTVRFRKDTNELRWTYANPQAWKALESGAIDYPEGSVLAKVGVATADDPQFISSAVPSGARRYQIMVRDQKKYASTGGWGYALFDVAGKTFPEDPKLSAMACYACHSIVKNRGQVFSQPFSLASQSQPLLSLTKSPSGFSKIEFAWLEITKLPAAIRKVLPEKTNRVRVVTNSEITKNIFQGTLDEIKPTLELEAYLSKAPAILMDMDEKRFSVVAPTSVKGCGLQKAFVSISTLPKLEENSPPLQRLQYCNP